MTSLKSITRWVVTCSLVFTGFAAQALTLPPGVEEVAHVEGITEYRLTSNGFRFLLAPDNSRPSVTVNMTYLVGSRHENYGQTGMAHLLEHMIFKGTPSLRNALGEFTKRGLRANGTTSPDRTNYFATFASNPETLDWYIRWQADAMVNSLILQEDLDSEMTVVRNEMEEGENNPFGILYQKSLAAAFQWHNYGKSVIGARSDVEGVDIEQLRDFYRIYYQPDNAVLMVAGQFDEQSVMNTIVDAFGSLPKPDRVLPRLYTVEPVQDGERSVVLRRSGGTPFALVLYRTTSGGHPDYPALELATAMLTDRPSGQLFRALVPTELATDVFGFTRPTFDPGTVTFGADVAAGVDPEPTLEVMTQILENMAAEPFTQQELERARTQWMNGWDQLYSNIQRVGVAVSEPIAQGDWRMMFKHRDRIREVTLEDVQRVVEQYFVAANRTTGIYVPTDRPVRAPANERFDIAPLLEGYVGDAQVEMVEAFEATPANIDKMTDRRLLNLPNGPVKMALLNKPTRGERVFAEITIQFGNVDSLKGKSAISTVTASMLDQGTSALTREQIRDRLKDLNAQIAFGGSDTDVSINISTVGRNLPEVTELALHILRHANFPAPELQELKAQIITSIKSSMSEPGSVASRALARYENPWPSDDPRYVPTFEELIDNYQSVTREEIIAFHDQFYGAGNISIAVVGAFDPEAFTATVSSSLKGWQKAPAYTRIPNPYQDYAPTFIRIDTPDKANAVFLARLTLPMQDTNADYPALVMANFLLGGSPNSRMWMRIRETDGLSYSLGSRLSASAFEPDATWRFSGIVAPENWEPLRAGMFEEIDRALRDGFTEEEVTSGIEALINSRALNRANDGALVGAWINFLELNRTFAWSAEFDEKLRSLDVEAVNAALRKYIDPQKLVQVLAGDFER